MIGDLEGLRGLVCALLFSTGCHDGSSRTSSATPAPVRIAAAANLGGAFEALERRFEELGLGKVELSFGSSGLLTKQIVEGAPFDLFAAADVGFAERAARSGLCDPKTLAKYARGRIVVWSRNDGVPPPTKLEDLVAERFRRISIANPESAPHGAAARQALSKLGIWAELEPRLVYAEDVRQALQLAETGNTEAGLVSLALVALDQTNPWIVIDSSLHTPLDQALVVCTRGANRAGAEAFVRLLDSAEGRALMRRHGFVHPADAAEDAP